MRPRREVLELIGAYAAGELAGEEEREVERLLAESEEYRRVAESYARMLALLSALSEETVEVPEEEIVDYVVRRAYVSAFVRQAEHLLRGLAADYLGALTFYLGLRPADRL
ncbi:MAG: zf-HC2 domain-containing protein [Actinomycetota bacterium]